MRDLSLLETRVLGTLYEKQHTVPDSYPLTLNALVSGANQKTSRSPVMEATESEVQAALDSLKSANCVMETSGGRVSRYSHNFERVLQVPSQSAAILTVLMLRGPQTAGELRINCERLHSFADISAVEGFLEELAARPAGPLVVQLARLPGSHAQIWGLIDRCDVRAGIHLVPAGADLLEGYSDCEPCDSVIPAFALTSTDSLTDTSSRVMS